MNAAIAVRHPATPRTEKAETHQAAEPLSFGQTVAWTSSISLLVAFGLSVVGLVSQGADLWGAIGIGAYIAFWVGGGFGFLIGGVLHSLRQEEHGD